jgi:polysaccharide export outer membrane protein
MRSSRTALVLAVVAGLLGLGLGGCRDVAVAPYPASEPVAALDSAFGPGDLFEVRVYNEPQLSGPFQVEADGSISFFFVGRVVVQGKTPPEVEHDIALRLADGYIKNPQVTVLAREYRSKKVSVIGMVKSPGTFPFQQSMTVVDAIALSGGFMPLARKNAVRITRRANGKNFTVAVDDINKGKSPNFLLRPGDEIYVPERPM